MRSFLLLLALVLAVAARAADALVLVASVRDVGMQTKPRVDFTIHSPGEYAGIPMALVLEHGTRKEARSQFPIGALFVLRVPKDAVAALAKATRDQEHIETQIDAGVRPELISQFVVPLQVNARELLEAPIRFVPADRPNQ